MKLSPDLVLAGVILVVLVGAVAMWRWRPELARYLHTAIGPVPRLVFVVFFLAYFVWITARRPRVMVLHSYSTDFSWVRDINVGIDWELGRKAFFVRHHYMDTKRNPSKDYKQRAGQQARQLIESWEPNVLIAVDDDAQEYAAKHFVGHPRIDIVYTGVNLEPVDYGYEGASNVTGLLERIPFAALKELMMDVMPCPAAGGAEAPRHCRLIHLSDASETSAGIHRELEAFDWAPIEVVEHRAIETYSEWEEQVRRAQDRADLLLITHYHTLRDSPEPDSRVLAPPSVLKWTLDNSRIPSIGGWGFFVEDGGMLALGVSPFETGQIPARMAVKIIEGKMRPAEIEPAETHHYLMYAREERLKESGVELPPIFEAFARATNNYYSDDAER